MVMSVNTNAGAMIALQSLTKTTNMLSTTQFRITTGLRVNGPKDDAATFAIAQNMRGDIAGMSAVKTNLSLGQSVVSVAIDAGTAIADLLTEMKAKSVQASQAGLDSDSYTALNQEFTSLRAQLTTIVETAEFNGTNLITSVAANLDVLSTVDGSTITVTAQKLDTTTLVLHTAALTTAATASQARVLIDTAITSSEWGFMIELSSTPSAENLFATLANSAFSSGGCRGSRPVNGTTSASILSTTSSTRCRGRRSRAMT